MSRVTKPPPYGHHLEDLSDAYQICARCGEILAVGETVQVVYRGDRGTWRGYINPAGPDWWGIYTHVEGPDCPPGAASGWLAVGRAIDMRGPDNPTISQRRTSAERNGQEAQPVTLWGFVFPFVSLLDGKHCERRVVTVSLREILVSDRGSAWSASDDTESDERDDVVGYEYNVGKAGNRYNYVEDAYIQALDKNKILLGKSAELIREVTARERTNLYGGDCVGGTMDYAFEFYYPGDERRNRATYETSTQKESTKTTLESVTHGEVLTSDIAERPVEYALYSKMPVTFGEHGDQKFWLEGKILDELRLHLLSGPKPTPVSFMFDSRRFPELFESEDAPSELAEQWPRNPPSPLAGRPARLKTSVIGKL